MRRTRTGRAPIPRDAWPIIRQIKQHFNLSNRALAAALEISESRVKQGVNDWEQYRTESGGWSVRPRRSGGESPADPIEGAGEG